MTWTQWGLAWWIALVLAAGAGGLAEGDEVRGSHPLGRAPTVPAVVTSQSAWAPVPVAVEAPAVGLSASLVPVGKASDGSLELPSFGTAGWYEQSARPGAPGSTVLVGHVDSYQGPDVFFALKDLQVGDDVRVRRGDGSTVTYIVEGREETDKDELPVERIFDSPPEPSLRLVTCGGEFDRRLQSYESNVIVYARLAS